MRFDATCGQPFAIFAAAGDAVRLRERVGAEMALWSSKSRTADDGRTGTTASAPARRMRRAGISDARLWLGLALVVGSVVVGARMMGADDDSVAVLRASRDLAVGSPVDGLVPVRVSRAAAGDGYLSEPPPTQSVLRWPIAAGELVPRSAVAVGPVASVREVTIPVDPLHAPPGVQSGDLVDIWSSPRESEPGGPVLVLADVTVAAVATDEFGIGGEIGVVLAVPAEEVAAVVQASRTGVVDLVKVPVGSQAFDDVTRVAALP